MNENYRTIERINSIGLRYQLWGNDKQTTITLISVSPIKSIVVIQPLEVLNQAWYNWMHGEFIQNAFKMLSSAEREFLITGITASEWAALFNNREEE